MQQYTRPNSLAKATVSTLEPQESKRQVSVLWLATKSRKAFTETLRG